VLERPVTAAVMLGGAGISVVGKRRWEMAGISGKGSAGPPPSTDIETPAKRVSSRQGLCLCGGKDELGQNTRARERLLVVGPRDVARASGSPE
jgi:hypothetical protein